MMPRGSRPAAALLALAVALGSGCASAKGRRAQRASPASPGQAGSSPLEPTVVSKPEYRDPLIHVNRVFFAFNDVAFRYLLIPLSKGYKRLIPERARDSVGNFFHNIKTPVYAANDLLQLKPRPLGRHLSRFVINSTVGLAGLFDPAKTAFGLERTQNGFGATLSRYGAGYGFYVVLPVYGSSDLRSGVGLAADYFLNPIPYLTEGPATTGVMAFDNFQVYAPGAEDYKVLRREADDPYVFFRNLYLQGVQRDDDR